jgi:hypothetical protein
MIRYFPRRNLSFVGVSSIAEPGTDQRKVGRACRHEADGEEHVHALQRGFEGRSHGENIGRFWRWSLGQYFSPDSGLVYDSVLPDAADAALTCL